MPEEESPKECDHDWEFLYTYDDYLCSCVSFMSESCPFVIWWDGDSDDIYRCVKCQKRKKVYIPGARWAPRRYARSAARSDREETDERTTYCAKGTEHMIRRLLIRLSTRRCRGCDDHLPHSHHLTWLGRRRYT